MIPEQSTHSISVSTAFHTKKFGIDDEDFSHLVDLIQNQLYSDKPLALVREYSCNAFDANVVAGRKETPIKISLPSAFSSQLVIRDYGHGLTQDQMESIFTRYGKSTKRNDNTTVGCFGIGSKAAFSYTPSFMVNSYIDGKVTSYNCVLDETNVGKLILLGEDTTTEPNGLEIAINIKKDDVDNFRSICMKFFRYWDVLPVIEGFTDDDYAAIRGSEKPILTGTGWAINDSRVGYFRRIGSVAVMGNIGYPIQWQSVKGLKEMFKARGSDHYNMEQFILESNIVFQFNIGEIKMSPSREALQYTELTNNALVKRVEVLLNEIADHVQTKIDMATNLWEAKIMFADLFSTMGALAKLRNSIKLNYKSIPIAGNRITGFDTHSNVLKTYYRRADNAKFHGYDSSNATWNSIECADKKMILELDRTDKVYIQKAVTYLDNIHNVNTMYVLTFKDQAERDAVFADTHLDDAFITKYSTISDAVKNTIVRRSAAGGTISATKDTTVRSLRYVDNKANRSYYYNHLRDFSHDEVDMSIGGVYLETDHSDIIGAPGQSISDIIDTVKAIAKYDEEDVTVYFIGQNLIDGKLMSKGKWVKYADFVNDKAKTVIENDAELELLAAFNSVSHTGDIFTFDPGFVSFITANCTTLGADLVSVNNLFLKTKDTEMYLVRNRIVPSNDSKKKVSDMFTNLKAKYPLVRVINNSFRNSSAVDENAMRAYLK